MKYIKRLYMKTDDTPFNPFLHAFVLKTFAFGIVFTFLDNAQSVEGNPLLNLTNNYLPNQFGNLWGLALLLVAFGHVCEMLFRGKGFGGPVALLGAMCWGYAGLVFALNEQWFRILGIVALDLFFWGWYYVNAIQYARDLKTGKIDPVS